MAASDVAATRAHDAIVSVPESHDDSHDFSIDTASHAAVAANEESAWQFRTAARFNTAARGSDASARDIYFPRLAHKTAHRISVLSLLPSLL